MRGLKYQILLIIACLLSAAAVRAETVTQTTLSNGMKVIVREGRSVNLAAIDIWIRAGSANETDANSGVSHFIEHMIFKSGAKYGPGQVDQEIESLGAELNAGTSKDYVHFYTTVPSQYLPIALDVLADAIMNSRFQPEEMEKERRIILDEIARADADPARRAFNLLSKAAFTSHGYRFSSTGTRESVNKLTRDNLIDYYNSFYTPANTCVAIAGDVTKDEAVAAAKKAFEGFGAEGSKTDETPAKPEPAPAAPRVVRYNSKIGQAFIALGFPAPAISQFREACTLDVILALLGNTNRGRLSTGLNGAGIRYSKVTADYISQRDPTVLYVFVQVDPENINQAATAAIEVLRALAVQDVPAAELGRAKGIVEGRDLYEQETFSGQARALGLYATIGSYDMALKYGPTVRSITSQEVRAVAGKYFTPDNYTLVLVNTPKQVADEAVKP